MGSSHDHAHSEEAQQGPAHDHDHAPRSFGRAFAIGIALQTAFIVAEVIVGLAANSLAVLADAGHNVSDVLALALAWGAAHLGKQGASKGRTYGWRSASILAALANALTLVFVNGAVAWEAVGRLRHPEPVAAIAIVAVSAVGLVVNGVSAFLFAKGSEDDINVRAAFLHLASDAAVAAGVAITGALIWFTGLRWLDPAASLVVAVVVLASTWSLLRRALDLALAAVPRGVDEKKIETWLRAQDDVEDVHDLHVWGMSTTENALTAHLVMRAMPTDARAVAIDRALRAAFRVHHVTLQMDPRGCGCLHADPDAI